MTSKEPSSECYVYIMLPGQVSAVTARRFVLEKNIRGDALGRFVYGSSYLQNPDAVVVIFSRTSCQLGDSLSRNGTGK